MKEKIYLKVPVEIEYDTPTVRARVVEMAKQAVVDNEPFGLHFGSGQQKGRITGIRNDK